MSASSTTITLDRRLAPLFISVGAAAGLVLALLAGPLTAWLLGRLDSAPVPLRVIAEFPLVASAPILTIVGAVAGWFVFAIWEGEVGMVEIDEDGILLSQEKTATRFAAGEVAEAFIDEDQLVLVDHSARELSRTATDSSLEPRLRTAFGSHGYNWRGRTDPREAAFIPWVDRDPHCAPDDHALLRARQRALTDKRTGEAATLRDDLSARGIVVRDKGGAQQIRQHDG